MKYAQDWVRSKERFTAFWQREIVDRCLISATAPIADDEMPPAPPADMAARWTDAEYVAASARYGMRHTHFAGDAFPLLNHSLGASGHAGFFKGERHQFEDTVWFFPGPTLDEIVFDENSFLFHKTVELPKAYVRDSGGDYFISMPDGTGNADALSHLIGAEALLEAMIEEPEKVEAALKTIEKSYERAMREVYAITKENNDGGASVGWLRTWAPGFHAQMQSDMSVMISAKLFERFIMPELVAQCDFLEYPLYHFDGIEQIRHLDMLLSIPRLKAIQWTQVTGHPPATEYIPELLKIQRAGKCLVVIVSPDQVEPLMTRLSSRGLYLLVYADTPQQAEEVVKLAARLTRD